MYLNNFSVRVIGGKEVSGGYVELAHGRQYTLSLRNDRGQRCDARVEIDGKHVGTWRIGARQTIALERPANDEARFTFYRVGTSEAEAAQLQTGDPNFGLVKVTFTPERIVAVRPLLPEPWTVRPPVWPSPYWYEYGSNTGDTVPLQRSAGTMTCSFSKDAHSALMASAGVNVATVAATYGAGGTELSGHSDQQYGYADCIDPDLSQQTVIHLRLVVANATETPRPLTTYSTPVPPAVT